MDKVDPQFLIASQHHWLTHEVRTTHPDSNVCIADKRVARLLLVLSELDECVAGLEGLPKADLSDLISSAIRACGFENEVEAKYAIATVLRAIEVPATHGYS